MFIYYTFSVVGGEIMYCPKCGSENIRHGFSGGELYGDSWTDIYCADCKKSFHIVERKSKRRSRQKTMKNISLT